MKLLVLVATADNFESNTIHRTCRAYTKDETRK